MLHALLAQGMSHLVRDSGRGERRGCSTPSPGGVVQVCTVGRLGMIPSSLPRLVLTPGTFSQAGPIPAGLSRGIFPVCAAEVPVPSRDATVAWGNHGHRVPREVFTSRPSPPGAEQGAGDILG